MTTAFQPNAFQFNAFQIDAGTGQVWQDSSTANAVWQDPARSTVWQDSSTTPTVWAVEQPAGFITELPMAATYPERVGGIRSYAFDFGNFYEIATAGETLSGAPTVSYSPNDGTLTLGAPSISGTQVRVLISGGTVGTTYSIVFVAPTNGGHTIVGAGGLLVISNSILIP